MWGPTEGMTAAMWTHLVKGEQPSTFNGAL